MLHEYALVHLHVCANVLRRNAHADRQWDIGREDVHDRHSRITYMLSRHQTQSEEMCMRMDKCAQTVAEYLFAYP